MWIKTANCTYDPRCNGSLYRYIFVDVINSCNKNFSLSLFQHVTD